jgi:hypothetical protein
MNATYALGNDTFAGSARVDGGRARATDAVCLVVWVLVVSFFLLSRTSLLPLDLKSILRSASSATTAPAATPVATAPAAGLFGVIIQKLAYAVSESEADRQLRQAMAQTPATPAQPVCSH